MKGCRLILLSQKVAAAGGFALVSDLLGCCFVIREAPAMPDWTAESEAAFDAYVDALIGVIGHADRAEPLKDYCLGLLMPIERKSVEPLAAVTAPSRVSAKHQSLLHFVGQAPWSDAALLARVGDWVLPRIEQRGPIRAWIVDDTGFPKKGKHSVGVARQYCGQLGKQDNCQIAVSLSIANDAASLPIAYELYLPHSWAEDPEQRKKAKIPAEITFRPSRRSRSSRSGRPRPKASRPAWFSPTPDMAPTAVSARACPSSV